MKNKFFLSATALIMAACTGADTDSGFTLNEQEYFERQGVNVLVYSNLFTGGFNDEKTSGIELIHHGVRTAQGGAVRLSHTPEQWELVPATTSRTVNKTDGSIEVSLRYEDYAPGLLFRYPDHFENYDDWPFFWGQNEGTIAGNISYLIFGSAFKNLVTE